MERQSLDFELPSLCLGGGNLFETLSLQAIGKHRRILAAAMEQGLGFYDTANSYSFGLDEKILGGAVEAYGRDRVLIATKVGYLTGIFRKIEKKLMHSAPQCFEKNYILRQCSFSLRRLRVSFVDIYYLHSPGADLIKSENWEAYDALRQLKSEGKIRATGVSCRQVADAMKIPRDRVNLVQIPIELPLERLADDVLKLKERGFYVILRQPFRTMPNMEECARETLSSVLPKWQILRKMLSAVRPDSIVFSTTNHHHLSDNLKAAKFS